MNRVLLAVILIVSVLGVFPAAAQGNGASIDPWVLRTTEGGATTSFLVVLKEQADTSGAAALATKEAKGQYVTDRLMATASATQGALKAYLDSRGVPYRAFWIVNMLQVEGDRALVMELAARPEVDRISGNPRVRAELDTPAEAAERNARVQAVIEAIEWGITNTNAPQVWAQGYDGTGIVVAGEDTGYRWTHVALQSKYRGWNGVTADHDYNWHDAIHSGGGVCGANAPAPCDDSSHGTHTMGTMVGGDGNGPDVNDVGMAYGAKWIGCRNMDQGTGTPATYIECHEFMLAPTPVGGGTPDPTKAPHVINNSWGCPVSEGCTDVNILRASIEALTNAGIVFVASAGNGGPGCSSVDDPPGIYEASFSVGATSSTNSLASFSSRGPVTVDGSNRLKPNISAPGANVRSSTATSDTSYEGGWSGTSMASPHVAGAVALLLDARPDLIGNVAQIRHILEATANPAVTATGTCGGTTSANIPNNLFGYGRVDVLAAVLWTPTAVAVAGVQGTAVQAGAPLLVAAAVLLAAAAAGMVLARRRG